MRARAYRFHETIDALHARAAAAVASDDRAERLKNRSAIGCVVTGVAAGVVFFGGLMAGTAWAPAAEWAAPVAFALLVAGVVVGMGLYAYYSTLDLDDRKLGTLQKLIAVLRADVPARAPVLATVDFRGYRQGRLLKKEGGFFSRQGTYVYAQPWLSLNAPLADGSRLQVDVEDRVKRKEKSKRKYTKVREAARSRISLVLRLGKAHSDPAAVLDELRTAPLPAQLRLIAVHARGRTLAVRLLSRPDGRVIGRGGATRPTPLAPSDGDTLLLALRWVYRGLRQPA